MPEPVRPAYHLYRWLWGSLDLLFPPTCGGCGQSGKLWCDACQESVREIGTSICSVCGQPWDIPGLCARCARTRPYFTKLRSWAYYDGPVSEAIKRLKYKRDISLGFVLAQALYDLLVNLQWQVDGVIPVPLGVARLKERGYNQAALIAQPVALRIGKPYLRKGLFRVRETRSQVGLSYIDRQANVNAAFRGREEIVAGKRLLVVDDVTTSTATLNACSQALITAGAAEVMCLTVARAG
ncbi:MAG: ComF family protein [Anaerolineales bacterium]